MRMFRFPKRDPRYDGKETPLQRIVRILLIIILFSGVVYGFWLNGQRRMELMKKTPDTVGIFWQPAGRTQAASIDVQRQSDDRADMFKDIRGNV